MLTHDLYNKSCCDILINMEPSYRTKSNLNKNLFNQKETGYSSHSIIQCMETFVEAVHEMDDTILVPSRLLDLKADKLEGGKSNTLLSSTPDLFTLYTMARNLKNQLQWGPKEEDEYGGFLSVPPLMTKTHVRRPSTASMSSTNSSAASVISEPDSETSLENDSGIDAELEVCKTSALDVVEQSFQRHLRGLGDSLRQLTEAAKYVTKRYQKDVLGVE